MIYKRLEAANQDEVHQLFYSVFRDSESEEEGLLIGHLASELCAAIDNQDNPAYW